MQNTSVLNFAVELHKSGDIKFYYGSLNDYPIMEWISGVSAGDNKYYQFSEVSSDPSIPQEYVCDLRASYQPEGFIVSRDGIFGGTPAEIYDNLEIKFRAQDENGLSNSKQLYFSTDGTSYLVVNDFSVISGDDDVIEFGETVSLSVDIKNLGEESIYGASIEISSENIYIVLVDSTEFLGDFGPGQVKTFETAFVFDIDNFIPDEYDIDINTYIADNSGNDWSNHLYLTAFAPEIYVGGVAIDDGGSGGLDPGETADMIVNLCNGGGATAENLIVTLSSSDPYVTINSNIANLSNLNGNDVGQVTFSITASDQTPMGHILEFDVDIEADNDYVTSDVAFVLVGLINESFETGDFSAYPWSFGGDSEWIIDNEEYFEGAFSARSGDIDDDQKSSLLLNIYVIGDGEISFYKKVSSEASYDYLRFFIDAEEMVSWAGDIDWGIVTYPVSQGLHEFEWMYEKDYSVSTGSDCGWIDFITFPLFGDPNPSMSYEPSSFVLTVGNEVVADTITLTNEGDGPLIYNVSAIDTLGLVVDWLNIGSQSGGINSGGSKEIPVVFDATNLEEGNYVAYIIVADHMDNEHIIPVFMFVDVETGIENETVINGAKNIPNPFRNWTNITFSLSQPENVSLEIFDHFGTRVKTLLLNKEYSEGSHSIKWEGTNEHGVKVTPGLYYYRMTVERTIQSGKMILLD